MQYSHDYDDWVVHSYTVSYAGPAVAKVWNSQALLGVYVGSLHHGVAEKLRCPDELETRDMTSMYNANGYATWYTGYGMNYYIGYDGGSSMYKLAKIARPSQTLLIMCGTKHIVAPWGGEWIGFPLKHSGNNILYSDMHAKTSPWTVQAQVPGFIEGNFWDPAP